MSLLRTSDVSETELTCEAEDINVYIVDDVHILNSGPMFASKSSPLKA
jgi:hypothetical protein